MKGAPCVVSVAEHTGWAHLVCVAAPGQVPAVIERRRVTLIDSGLPTQPYEHESTAMTRGRGQCAHRAGAAVNRGPHLRRIDARRDRTGTLRTPSSPSRFGSPRLPTFPKRSRLCGNRIGCNAPRTGCCISWPSVARRGSSDSMSTCAAVARRLRGPRSNSA